MENTIEYKCPNCKAPLEYNSEGNNIKCEYCDSVFSISELRSYSEELKKAKADEVFWNSEKTFDYTEEELKKLNIYLCSGCNGEVIADENTSATRCPYCDSPVILKGRLSGTLKPDYIIPFKKDDKDAKNGFYEYLKNKILLPRVFKHQCSISEIKGLYVPYWIYDSDSDGRVEFIGERHHTYRSGDYEYDETSYYQIVREGSVSFRKVPQDASKKIDDALMESVEPFDFSEAKKFDTPYLTGYYSDKYDVTKEEAFPRIKKRIIDGTINEFRNTVGMYSNVRVVYHNISLNNVKAYYSLYPIWLLNIKWNDKVYNFAMNGETGKIKGDLPISSIRFGLSIVVLLVGGSLLGMLISYLLNGGYFDDSVIGTGIFIGIIITIIGAILLKKQMKGIKKKVGAADYCDRNSLNIKFRTERFLRKSVNRRRINNGNGGGQPPRH